MHEESLTRSLLHQVEHLAQQHAAFEVEEIEVECGPLSGVEPLLLHSAFERLKPSSALNRNAALSLREVGLEVVCLDCSGHSCLTEFRFVCPICDSTNLRVLRGDSLRLLNVRFAVPEEHCPEVLPKARAVTAHGDAPGRNETSTQSPSRGCL